MINKIKEYFYKNCNGNYTFKEINDYIGKCYYYKIIKYNNIKLIILYDKKNVYNYLFFKKIIKRLYLISNNKILNYYILLSPFKRFIPKNDIIKPININGGFTFINGNNIYVYRKEELPKVLLHETIHHLINIEWKEENIKRLKKEFNIDEKTELNPNEAIIELFATILQIYFISKNNFIKLIKEEINYSKYKCYQLLKLLENKKWYEITNAYCYIIFKTILLINFKKYIKEKKFIFNDDYITDFLIKYKKISLLDKNPTKKRKNNSLCMMIYSDM